MIRIDYSDATPLYEQIVERYKNLIAKGVLAPDEKMPSVRNLAMELSMNPNTIQKAFTELERQGFIYAIKGRGNFVAGNQDLKDVKRKEILEKLDLVIKEADEAGIHAKELLNYLNGKLGGENID
ncbi:MAG: GntR family transcriptional regulator [Lachnospiraceae bacterium]